MHFSQGQIWYERALFYGQKGDRINARRAYNIALRHDPTLPPLPKFYNHALLKKCELVCLIGAIVLFCWLLYLLFWSPAAVLHVDFPWRINIFRGVKSTGQVGTEPVTAPAETVEDPDEEFTVNVFTWEHKPARTQANKNPRYAAPASPGNAAGQAGFGPYETYALIRNALFCYARDQGHFPERLGQLVEARYLDRIPPDPLTGSRQVHSRFSYSGGWVYLRPPTYAAPQLREQVEMALYINDTAAPLTPFVPRSLKIDPVEPSLTLFEGTTPLKKWPVSLGGAGTPTPVGAYLIIEKQILDNTLDSNPFGSRWLKLGETYPYSPDGRPKESAATDALARRGIGIHGTNQPDSIGDFTTAGCIRLYNADVEELYQHIPNGTAITIGS